MICFQVLIPFSIMVQGQELNCTVQIVSPQIQDAAAQNLFSNLRQNIYNFMNSTKWTTDNFTNSEKIDCSIFINMTAQNNPGDYSATMQIQSHRPIYKSSYTSALLNFQDNNIHILYVLNQPIIFNLNIYSDNLTALLSFYAYIIIGTDYDTYSSDGGTPYFLDAQTILNNAQPSQEKGWNPQDGDQTRYTLITNILDENYYEPLRKASYKYHRLGLDVFYTNPQKGRAEILDALGLIQQVYNLRPANYNVQLFFNAKSTEIANVFSEATSDEKTKIFPILQAIDPTDNEKYLKLNPNSGE